MPDPSAKTSEDAVSSEASTGESPETVPVRFLLDDPEALTGTSRAEWELTGEKDKSLLDVALEAGIHVEHACGGVCACSTCHVYVEDGMDSLTEAEEDEDDRVEEAPGLQRNSRLACQARIIGDGPITVRVPGWNRNAVKENPH